MLCSVDEFSNHQHPQVLYLSNRTKNGHELNGPLGDCVLGMVDCYPFRDEREADCFFL